MSLGDPSSAGWRTQDDKVLGICKGEKSGDSQITSDRPAFLRIATFSPSMNQESTVILSPHTIFLHIRYYDNLSVTTFVEFYTV